eukprot:13461357-Alexandrium_andersonii.AAC.1
MCIRDRCKSCGCIRIESVQRFETQEERSRSAEGSLRSAASSLLSNSACPIEDHAVALETE